MPPYTASPRRRLRVLGTCAAALISLSCSPSSWTPLPSPVPGVLPPDTRLQVWRSGRAVILREVTIDADSIRGRVDDPFGGRSRARVALARSDIDWLRLQPRDEANWFGAGVGVGILGAIVVPYMIRLLGPRGT
jgi:hypothetical protein